MRRVRSLGLCAAVTAAALMLNGCCSFIDAPGDGPLGRDELGDWLGMSAAAELPPRDLEKKEEDLRLCINDLFAGEYSTSEANRLESHPLAVDLDMDGRSNFWLHLFPSFRQAHWLFHRRYTRNTRRFYANERKWGLGWLLPIPLGELLFCGRQIDAYDVDSGKRVGSVRSLIFLTPLFCVRERVVRPVDTVGRPGLRAIIDAGKDMSAIQYEAKDATVILLGALGWGRVNHRAYAQVLWIPIPLWSVGVTAPPS